MSILCVFSSSHLHHQKSIVWITIASPAEDLGQKDKQSPVESGQVQVSCRPHAMKARNKYLLV